MKRVIRSVPAFVGAIPESVPFENFEAQWAKTLHAQFAGLGVNWEGPRVAGPEMPAEAIFSQVKHARVTG